MVIDSPERSSTRVSAGIINPMVLKRFTPVWNARQHINTAIPFYQCIEKKLKAAIFQPLPMFRIFTSVEEQNNWMVASDKKELSGFLHPEIIKNTNPFINAPYGMGKVHFSGTVNTQQLVTKYQNYLSQNNTLLTESFYYEQLIEKKEGFEYKNILAKKIVFSEGFSARNNPFFKKELVIPNKGEFITISAPKLQLHALLKSSIFVVPLGGDLYKIGATYNREDTTLSVTQKAGDELIAKFKKISSVPYEIIDHVAGMRPTTLDRRPLLGNCPNQENIFFFTGLGTRGMISAPSLAQKLFDYIENNIPLEKEIDIKRRC